MKHDKKEYWERRGLHLRGQGAKLSAPVLVEIQPSYMLGNNRVNRTQYRRKFADPKYTKKYHKYQKSVDELEATRQRVKRTEAGEKARVS